jgi:methanogenic corrinoid protein MtbC1
VPINVWTEFARSEASALASTSAPLMTLTYRSRAAAPMSTDRLRALHQAASARNRAEGVTGVVLYDEQRFFQWIEGPPASLARIWSSISQDPRHTDIEAISVHAAPTRLFSQWDMRLFTSRREMTASMASPALLADPDAHRLATLAIGDDVEAARALLRESLRRIGSVQQLTEQLIEPAARYLGDLWSDDDCGEYEVTLGLCRLQTFMRDITAGSVPDRAGNPLVVLVAPLPGEIHLLGATLGAEAAWKAGWETHIRFPSTDEALNRIVATNWFDAIDLSLSPALHREHRLASMEHMIDAVRRASQNPALIVVAGGRAFHDGVATRTDVGADAIHRSAADLERAILQTQHNRSPGRESP